MHLHSAGKKEQEPQCGMRKETAESYNTREQLIDTDTDLISQNKENSEILEHGTLRDHLQMQDTTHS